MIRGYATLEHTKNYFNSRGIAFKSCDFFSGSEIAIGTHLGNFSDEDSNMYINTLTFGLQNGINFIDTAVNYRGMRSEVDIGIVLKDLISTNKLLTRDEIIISTKGGQIFGDILKGIPPIKYIDDVLIKNGIIKYEDLNIIDNARFTMHPDFYEFTIEQSRKNLGVETIDIHYIHDPETSRQVLGEEAFYHQLKELIKFYESKVDLGHIRFYGMATWDCFISDMDSPWYISMEKVINIVHSVAGDNHHFKFIQLPYNKINTKAKTFKNQHVSGELYSAIDAAKELGLTVTISSPLNQMEDLDDLNLTPKDLIEYVTSTDGVFSTMIGMKNKDHLKYNMEILKK
ncbi:MAG: aldo/keto reductase [Clostridium sp.]|uniref:aldo/keto reductase n=1 Tax=Clostridium sp. TaxID=1506 RepID=UPI003217B51F